MQMTFVVAAENGHFRASVFGLPQESAVGPTREVAVAVLRSRLEQRPTAGELVTVEVGPPGLIALAGKYKDDPALEEIVREAYRQRDEEKAREFPE